MRAIVVLAFLLIAGCTSPAETQGKPEITAPTWHTEYHLAVDLQGDALFHISYDTQDQTCLYTYASSGVRSDRGSQSIRIGQSDGMMIAGWTGMGNPIGAHIGPVDTDNALGGGWWASEFSGERHGNITELIGGYGMEFRPEGMTTNTSFAYSLTCDRPIPPPIVGQGEFLVTDPDRASYNAGTVVPLSGRVAIDEQAGSMEYNHTIFAMLHVSNGVIGQLHLTGAMNAQYDLPDDNEIWMDIPPGDYGLELIYAGGGFIDLFIAGIFGFDEVPLETYLVNSSAIQ